MKLKTEILNEQNVFFIKESCPFCTASLKLAEVLKEIGIFTEYRVYELKKDFQKIELEQFFDEIDQNIKHITFPQIFINGLYIGTNNDFYNSIWNLGNEEKLILIGDKKIPAPRKFNPMDI
jgi:glutaredoxin